MGAKLKFKPRKALVKRVKVTATGKVKGYRAGKRHLLSVKGGGRRRKMRHSIVFTGGDETRALRLLGMK